MGHPTWGLLGFNERMQVPSLVQLSTHVSSPGPQQLLLKAEEIHGKDSDKYRFLVTDCTAELNE